MTHTRAFPETGIWKYSLNMAIAVLAAATLTFATASQSTAGPLPWDEMTDGGGDAGRLEDPQFLTGPIGTQYSGITGLLGFEVIYKLLEMDLFEDGPVHLIGPRDETDVFGFFHAGGLFSATMSFLSHDPFDIILRDENLNILESSEHAAVNATIGRNELAAGNYFLELRTGVLDPPFSISSTPLEAFRVGEPAMIAVFAMGLAAMGGLARRRQNKKA